MVYVFSVVIQDYKFNPQFGVCISKQGNGSFLIIGLMVVSMCIITGTSIYLRYKIINLNCTFKSVKRSSAEEQAAVKAGRLVEILQEQVKPTFTVFMAGRIDVVFSLSPIALFILRRIVNFDVYFKILSISAMLWCML